MIQKQQEQGAGQETSGLQEERPDVPDGRSGQWLAEAGSRWMRAAMTPAANPFKRVSRRGFKSFFRKNTQAAPKEVPEKGIRSF